MKIIPAIDLIDGKNVRLNQGDYDKLTLMERSPEETIKFYGQFDEVARIHVVDLIGARDKGATEVNLIARLKNLTDIPLEIGGGLRDMDTINRYNDLGIDYFILGTKAIEDINFLERVVDKYPGRIFVGVDAIEDRIMVDGWTRDSGRRIKEYLFEIEDLNLAGIIYTDIEKDGMQSGPNVNCTSQVQKLTKHKVVASGGVRGKTDLDLLEEAGIKEAIVGKAAHSIEFWEGLVE